MAAAEPRSRSANPGLERGGRLLGRAGTGWTTSAAKIPPAACPVASCSSCLEPECAYRPLWLVPIAASELEVRGRRTAANPSPTASADSVSEVRHEQPPGLRLPQPAMTYD